MDVLNQDIAILQTALGMFEFSMSWLAILLTFLPSLFYFVIYFKSDTFRTNVRNMLGFQLILFFFVYFLLAYRDLNIDHSDEVMRFIQTSNLSQMQKAQLEAYINRSIWDSPYRVELAIRYRLSDLTKETPTGPRP